MSFIRKIKKGNNIYLAEVENKREGCKVIQKVIRYIGKEIGGQACRRVNTKDVSAEIVKQYADILVIHRIAELLRMEDLFKREEGAYIQALVYSHLLERRSIRKLEDWFKTTEIPFLLNLREITTRKLYETLGKLSEADFSIVEERIFSRLKGYEHKKASVIVDVTDTYFEGNSSKDKPRKGKDGKYCKLRQIGLGITDQYGFPITIKTYNGNISNMMIFKDLCARLIAKGYKAVVIDRGMGSVNNIKEVLRAGMQIISGLRKTKKLAQKYLDRIERENIYSPENRVELKNTSVYLKEFSYLQGKIIAVYNPYLEVVKREKLFKQSASQNKALYVGYSFIYHNTTLPSEEVVKKYFEKDIIERAFKKMKGILSLRPIRVWTDQHVEGHIRICYLAYAILSYLEYFLKKKKYSFSVIDLLEKLKSGYRIYLKDAKSNFSWQTNVLLEKKLYKVFHDLNVVYNNG